jgi:fatty-acyl-CoA synthase
MAALVLVDGADLTPGDFSQFLASQPDLSPKAWPRHVWITDKLPTTATNKILKRQLSAHGSTPDGGLLWSRAGRGTSYGIVNRSAKAQVSPG